MVILFVKEKTGYALLRRTHSIYFIRGIPGGENIMNVWIFCVFAQTPEQYLLSANYVSGTILGARTQSREGLACAVDLPCLSHCGYFQI